MNFFETAFFWGIFTRILKIAHCHSEIRGGKKKVFFAQTTVGLCLCYSGFDKIIKDKFMSCLTLYAILDAEKTVPIKNENMHT